MSGLPAGTMGRVLEVDLASHSAVPRPLDARLSTLFLGGRGLGTALLMQEFLALGGRYANPFRDVDPLSPDNPLVISTSPANGTSVPTSARFHANFKSPLTMGIGSTNSGGRWGVEFKRTGYDALIVRGRSASPVVLLIDANGVRFDGPPDGVDADDVESITVALEARYGKGAKVMTVGAAGRRLARIAAIMNDKGRALGRGGGGAVFGSKNLFAIVVVGSVDVESACPEGLERRNVSGSVYKAHAKLRVGKLTKAPEQFGILPSMGTAGLLGMLSQYDELLHCNFRDTSHVTDQIERIGGEALASHPAIKVRRRACYQCPIGCTRDTEIVDADGTVVARGEGPEFETVAMFGADLDIYDLEPITEANYLCNRFGLDTISAGGTIAALMEIYGVVRSKPVAARSMAERQLMADATEFARSCGGGDAFDEHGPFAPAFGCPDVLVPLVRAMAKGDTAIGRALASGSRRLADHYGHPESAMAVKGMELPAYDPRVTWTQAMSYMTAARGGCHLQGGYSAPIAFCAGYGEFPGHKAEGAALVARNFAYQNTAFDVMGVCAFAGFSVTLDEYANMLNDVTGLSLKASDLEFVSRRVLTLERLFNVLSGFTTADDWLPDRFHHDAIQVAEGPMVCPEDDFKAMRSEYYESLGWDPAGVPRTALMRELDLDAVIDQADVGRLAQASGAAEGLRGEVTK